MMSINMDVSAHSSDELFGYWDPSGRALFWMFPKVSFTDVKAVDKVSDDSFYELHLASNPGSLLSETAYLAAVKQNASKLYLQVSNLNPSALAEKLTNDLIGLVSGHAKLQAEEKGTCRITALKIEILVGVNHNPEQYLATYLDYLENDARFSRHTPFRPFETMSD